MLRRATNLVPGLSQLDYEDRLKRLSLPTLAFRRLRGHMIETFKITSSLYDINQQVFFARTETTTRGHSHKFKKPRTCTRHTPYEFDGATPIRSLSLQPMECNRGVSCHLYSSHSTWIRSCLSSPRSTTAVASAPRTAEL